jgi:hypothetical protein
MTAAPSLSKTFRSPKISFALFCLVSIYHLLFLVAFVLLGKFPVQQALFNGDTLFLQDFAQEVLTGWNFRDWKFPIAPFLFPDALISFPAALIGWNNPAVYLAAYSYMQIAIGLFGVGLIAERLPILALKQSQDRQFAAAAIAISLGCIYWTLLVLFALIKWPMEHTHLLPLQPILPQMHGGSYAWTLVCYGLFLRWQRDTTKRLGTILIVALTLGCAGNTLFLATTLVPIGCSLAALQILRLRPLIRSEFILKFWPIALIAIFYVGRYVSNLVPHEKLDTQSQVSLEVFITSLNVFIKGLADHIVHFEVAHLIATLAFLGLTAWLILLPRKLMQNKAPAHLSFVILFSSAAIATPAVLVVGGSSGLAVVQSYGWTTKYLTPMIVGPAIAIYLLASSFGYCLASKRLPTIITNTRIPLRAVAFASVAFLAVFASLAISRSGVFKYRPAIIADLENCEELKDVKLLYCDFWQTRLVNLYGYKQFRASPILNDLTPFHWLSNRNRIDAPGSRSEAFAVLAMADESSADSKFVQQVCADKLGKPEAKVRINGEWLALIYNPSESSLRQASQQQASLK